MTIHKRASIIKQILPWFERKLITRAKVCIAIISTLKQDIVKNLLSEGRRRRSISSKEKSDYLIKVSQEFYDAISVVVCQIRKYDIFITLKYITHRDVDLFLLRKNAKFNKTREAVKSIQLNFHS